jgi:hypothetical protein
MKLYDRIEDEGVHTFFPVHDQSGEVTELHITTLKDNDFIISYNSQGIQVREVII